MRDDISGRPERDASPPETAVEHQLRRAILAAAIDELQKWSFERFSVETVADRAAVDPDVVHRRWKSKEQLRVDAWASRSELHYSRTASLLARQA